MTLYSKQANDALTVKATLDASFIAGRIAGNLVNSLATTIFADSQTVATGGAVLYQRVSSRDFYAEDDINARTEGAEYQIVQLPEPDIKRDPIEDLGGAFEVTDEAVERNILDVPGNGIIQVSNTIRRKLDHRILQTLEAAPLDDIVVTSTTGWNGFTTIGSSPTPRMEQPLGDLIHLDESFESDEFGQRLGLLLLNPIDASTLRIGYGEDLPDVLAAAGRGEEPVKIKTSSVIPQGTAYGLASVPGSLGVEKPLTVEIIPQRANRTTRVQAYIQARPYINRLYAVRKLVGI